MTISLYWDPITLINFNHIPYLAFFLATLHTQRDIFAWILLLLVFTFQEMFCSMKLISYLLSLYPIVPLICLLLIHSPQNLTLVLLFSYTLFPHLTLILILALIAIHSLLPSQHNMFLYLHLVKLFPPHLHLLFLSLPHLSHLFHHNLSLSPFHQSFLHYLYLIPLPQFHM